MNVPRITELRVEGLRTLADVRLKLDGLTVLIAAPKRLLRLE